MITTIITIYILSIIDGYITTRYLYRTVWCNLEPSFFEIIVIFIPIINIIWSLVILETIYTKKGGNYNKFFNL